MPAGGAVVQKWSNLRKVHGHSLLKIYLDELNHMVVETLVSREKGILTDKLQKNNC